MSFRREIKPYRKNIDECDRRAVEAHGLLVHNMVKADGAASELLLFSLLSNIATRFLTTDSVGELKIRHGIESVIQPQREQEVYDNVVMHNRVFEPLVDSSVVLSLWHSIHEESVARQEAQKSINFSGEAA